MTLRPHKTDKQGVKTMAQPITITIKLAVWFRFYVLGVVIMSALTGRKIDQLKLDYWLNQAITLTDGQGNKIKGLNNDSRINK
jgi:uncharacterized membrane protein